MLVLTRRLKEKLLFPGFNTSVQILDFKGGKVRLGIEAPNTVSVLREELQDGPMSMPPDEEALNEKIRQANHLLRNRLNVAGIGLALLTKQIQSGLLQEGQVTIEKIKEDFEMLRARKELDVEVKKSIPRPVKAARHPKALLVEDDQNERELLAGFFLRLSGMDVDVAADGVDALDYLRTKTPPDIILLDMILPRCDGPTTVRQIRSNPGNSRLKIFGVTGHAPESFHLEGVDRWFRKPLNPEVLLHDLSEEFQHAACN